MRYVVFREDNNGKRKYTTCLKKPLQDYWVSDTLYAYKFNKKKLAKFFLKIIKDKDSLHEKLGILDLKYKYGIEEID